MSLRIISGSFKGTVLKTPRGQRTRPTLGRHRESIFMMLQPKMMGALVLDLYAGSGSIGFEALSRGAGHVTFVENSVAASDIIQQNVKKLDVKSRTSIIRRDVKSYLKGGLQANPYDIIFMDPPYGKGLCGLTIDLIDRSEAQWLAGDGLIIAQASIRDPLNSSPEYLNIFRENKYRDTVFSFLMHRSD